MKIQSILKTAQNVPIFKPLVRHIIRGVSSFKTGKIANHLTTHLRPIIADTKELKVESFKIRHKVCCEELQALPVQPDLIERDVYDEHAIHCLIQHRSSGKYTGTIRVVYSRSSDEPLPLENFYLDRIYPGQIKPTDFARDKVCEVSRLIVPPSFRRRNMDNIQGSENGVINQRVYSEVELRCFPFIAVSLYLSAANVIIQNKFSHCFVMIEPRLAHSLDYVGIPFQQIGPVIDYFGKRAGYYITRDTLEKKLPGGITRLREVIYQKLYPSINGNDEPLNSLLLKSPILNLSASNE